MNKVLGKNFVTKYGTKQGILVLGKSIPFGIGAAIGAGGNLVLGNMTVRAARHAFGEPPAQWPTSLRDGGPSPMLTAAAVAELPCIPAAA